MKYAIILFVIGLFTLCGCTSTPAPQKYTVFTMNTTAEKPFTSEAAGLRLKMAEDLRAYNSPLLFRANGTVVQNKQVQYYAPLEIVLERALEDVTTFKATTKERIHVEVRNYCIIEKEDNNTLEIYVCLKVAVPGRASAMFKATRSLPKQSDADFIRDAFAEALKSAYGDALK